MRRRGRAPTGGVQVIDRAPDTEQDTAAPRVKHRRWRPVRTNSSIDGEVFRPTLSVEVSEAGDERRCPSPSRRLACRHLAMKGASHASWSLTHGEMSIDSFALGRALRMRLEMAKYKSTMASCDLRTDTAVIKSNGMQAGTLWSKESLLLLPAPPTTENWDAGFREGGLGRATDAMSRLPR